MIRRYSFILAASAVVGLAACGGGSGSPGGPSGGGGGGGSASPPPGEAATINILPTGVTPKTVTVPVGSRVNFANQSSSNIEISSDPHPIHTECPPLNIGPLGPGQFGQTGVFNTPRTCSYHDHGRSEDERWQGSIVIQ
jgi:hypothetical protein